MIILPAAYAALTLVSSSAVMPCVIQILPQATDATWLDIMGDASGITVDGGNTPINDIPYRLTINGNCHGIVIQNRIGSTTTRE